MDMFRLIEVACECFVTILKVLKVWLEWKTTKMKQAPKTDGNGATDQGKPRS